MSTLRISDAPLLPDVKGTEKIPTGGRGDYAVSIDQLKTFVRDDLPQQLQDHADDYENPHNVTKTQVGLGNVDNTSDTDKPVSTATQSALDLKANKIYVDGELNLKADKSTTYTKTEVDTSLALKANQTYVDTALSQLSTLASKFYPTLAEANADIANLEVNQPVQVGEAANGGLWYKATSEATSLTKSPHDPLTQAQADATEKMNIAENNAKEYTNEKTDFWKAQDIQVKQFDLWSPYAVGFVGRNGKMPLWIKKDGTVGATKANFDIMDVNEQSINGVKIQRLDPFSGYSLGIGNGVKFPFLVGNDGSVTIDKLNVNEINQEVEDESRIELNANIKNTTQEWWISPVHIYLDYPYPRVISGVYSETGEIVVSEYVVGCGTTKRMVVATTPLVDDHNAPSLVVQKDRRSIITWTQHNETHYIELKVSSKDGDIRTLEYADIQKLELGIPVSYTQLYKNEFLSDELQDTFWCFSRLNINNWHLVTFSVDHETGIATLIDRPRVIAGEAQFYFSTARHENMIRIAAGYNPAVTPNYILYYEIDMTTGDVKDMSGSVVANLSGTNLPIQATTSMSIALPQLDATKRRRLHYVRGELNPAIAYAEWEIADPDNAMYKVVSLEDDTWVSRDVVTAGKRFGYTASANYIGGISFPHGCKKDELIIARFDNATNEGILERAMLINNEYVRKEVLRVQDNHLLRPLNPIDGGDICMYTQLYKYGATSLFSFESDIKSIVMG